MGGYAVPVALGQTVNGESVLYGQAFLRQTCPNYIFISTKNGYSILEWLGGNPVIERDLLNGPLEQVGQTVLQNMSRGGLPIRVDIRYVHLSKQLFNTTVARLCR